MSFDDVKKAIFPVPAKVVRPKGSYVVVHGAGADTHTSRKYWAAVGETPTSEGWVEYEFIYCKEHDQTEAVPSGNMRAGLLAYWYRAGLHPRWSIWNEIVKRHPRFPRSGLFSPGVQDKLVPTLRKYKTKPEEFVKVIYDTWAATQPVRMSAGGRSWSVHRDIRDRYRAKSFTIRDFLAETNQTNRRLMLMSRSFTIEDVVKHMQVLAKDEEGEILMDRTPGGWNATIQHYLHVVCPTTGEHYLLGIPTRRLCQHGHPFPEGGWRADDGCFNADPTKVGWTPAAARRWTFGLEPDAEFVAEA